MKLKTTSQLFTSRFYTNVKEFAAEVDQSTKFIYTKLKKIFFKFSLFILVTLMFIHIGFGQTTQSYTATGNGTWTCPTGVTSITVQCWGAGGGGSGTGGGASGNSGAGCSSSGYGNGGAGGSYSTITYSVIPGTIYKYTVGVGGTAGSNVAPGGTGGTGGSTFFGNSVAGNASDAIVVANGGVGGVGSGVSSSALGSTTGCVGTTFIKGGNGSGFAGATVYSGAGGAGAGSTGTSANASGLTGGVGANGGGSGANGSTSNGAGSAGSQPGGGGSGGRNGSATCRAGGAGGAGKITITYGTPSNYLCSAATSLPCSTSNLGGSTYSTSNTAHGTGYSISNYGVWYTFTGDGNSTTISTTASGGFDHEMVIVSGSCGSFTAVASIDAALSNGTETYTFTSTNSLVYYVYVAYYSNSGTLTNVGSFTISRTCIIPLDISWTGSTSIDWNTASNWSTNTVPTENDNVTIPNGTLYSPTINTTTLAICKNLTVNSGATLTYTPNCSGTCAYYLDIYGNLINNGLITQTGTSPIFFNTSSTTISGSGDMSTAWLSIFACNVTLASDITVNKFTIFDNSSTFNLSSYSLIISNYFDQSGTLALNTGILEYRGTLANHTFNDSYLTEGTGTFYYNGINNSQTIQTGIYYNLKIATISGNTATIGSSAATTVSNDLTIINPSTAGGIASVTYDINVTGNTYIGNTGNALVLNMSNRIIGTGTFTMGNVATHAINISFAHATNFAITSSNAPIFYGTVTYTSASAQKVITATTYNNLTFALAGTKTLFGNLDVNGNLTLTAGTFDVSTFNVSLAGDLVKQSAATLTANTATFSLDGTATQYVNVTAAAGNTACDADITFYNLIIDGTDVKLYYNKTNNRKYNTNDFTVNSGKQVSFISQ